MKRLALPSTALLALVLAAGALAGASEPSTVTLELGPQPGYFSGKVKSDARTCKRNRRVVIKSDIDSSKVGSDRTNRRGRYGVLVALVPPLLVVLLFQVALDGALLGLAALVFAIGVLFYAWGPRDLDLDVDAVLLAREPGARTAASASSTP